MAFLEAFELLGLVLVVGPLLFKYARLFVGHVPGLRQGFHHGMSLMAYNPLRHVGVIVGVTVNTAVAILIAWLVLDVSFGLYSSMYRPRASPIGLALVIIWCIGHVIGWCSTLMTWSREPEAGRLIAAMDDVDGYDSVFAALEQASTDGSWDAANESERIPGLSRGQRNMLRRRQRHSICVQLAMEAKFKFPYLDEKRTDAVRLEVTKFVRDRLQERRVRPAHAVHIAKLATTLAFIPTADEVEIAQLGQTTAVAQRLRDSAVPWHGWVPFMGPGLTFSPK